MWHLGFFHIQAIVNKATLSLTKQIPVELDVHISAYVKERKDWSYDEFIFSFLSFSPIYGPTNSGWWSFFPHTPARGICMWTPSFTAPFFEDTFFNIRFWSACQILVAEAMCARLCLWYCSIRLHTWFGAISMTLLYIRFEIAILTLFLLVIIVLAILSWFHMNFRIFLILWRILEGFWLVLY